MYAYTNTILNPPTGSVDYNLFDLLQQIVKKIDQLNIWNTNIQLQNSTNLNFAWLMDSLYSGQARRLFCSVNGETIQYYDVYFRKNYIAIYSYEWSHYHTRNKYTENYSQTMQAIIDSFKIILLDILQDILIQLDSEFNISTNRLIECETADKWFSNAVYEFRITHM